MKKRPIVLCILDGYGLSERIDGNAVKLANTPNIDDLEMIYPTTRIKASGMPVGSVSYTHLRAHETGRNLVCRLLLEKKKKRNKKKKNRNKQ